MKRKTGSIRKILCVCAAVFLIAALSSAAFAMTIEEQMAANSAAWWIAHNAGDQATCDALHAANVALAEQLASGGGNATYQYGSWEIDTSSGDHISSAEGSRDGINDIVNYATTGSDGSISTVTDWSYTDSSIGSYYDYGGTDEGLVTSYDNIGEYVSTSNEYGSESAKLSGASEVAVVKALLGLTDAQAAQLQADLEASKQAFESAHAAYIAAKAAGDTEAMEAARAQMDAAHDAAQETRRQYNYTGDSTDYSDGGYYHGWGGGPEGEVPDDVPFFVIDVKPTHKITAIATGGCRSPLIVSPPIIAFMLLIICSCIRSISSKRSRACACAVSGNAATSATHASARTIRPSAPTTRNTTAKKPTVQPTRPFHAWRSTGRPSCRHIGSSTAALSCLRASAATMPRSMTGVCPVRHSSAE